MIERSGRRARGSEAVHGPPRTALALALVLLACLLAAPRLLAQEPGGAPPRYAGRPLAAALGDLRALGLRIVFTSRTVLPSMKVATEPTAGQPRRILEQLLAPHHLAAREGPSGSLVVVAASSLAGAPLLISGTVRERVGSTPVAGVELELVESAERVSSAADGTFRLPVPGPGSFALDVRRRGFVVEHLTGVVVTPDGPTELEVVLDRAPVTEERVVVTPSRVSLMREQPSMPLALSREDVLSLPHLGDDVFRTLDLLPGVASNDVSARFHVRGGRSDETKVVLDGQELYESYHLEDLDSALSLVAASTLDSVDLATGGFPVEHGDRMGGVLDMTTRTHAGPRRTHAGISLLDVDLGGSGRSADGRGAWLGQLRRGTLDLAGNVLGPERPQYWDAFGKLDYQLGTRQELRFNILQSNDELELDETQADARNLRATEYENTYLWLTHSALLGRSVLVESAVSRSQIHRDRRGVDVEDDAQFDIADRRHLTVFGLRQDWNWRATPRHTLKWGFERRDFDADFDYRAVYHFDSPLARIRENPGVGSTLFAGRFDADHVDLYLADRVQVGKIATLELGVRHDRHSLTDESVTSPRANLVVDLAARTALRASWGRFTQSQRPYELQVEDGETAFRRVERAEHQVLGLDHAFGGPTSPGPALRVELYRRRVGDPLPRHENLYEPLNSFPEVEPDRVLIAPRSSRAEGVELFLRGRPRRFGWWVNYSYSRTEDDLDGVWTPRRFDQTHALNLDLDLGLGPKWRLNLAWRFHTGWPTTPLTLEEVAVLPSDETGDLESGDLEPGVDHLPVLGPRFSDRLPPYHRLDLRARRQWRARSATVTFFVDVQNVYDRRNVAGFDYQIDEETGRLIANPETWARILPSLGIRLEF